MTHRKKVAIVTGGTRGIGLGVARCLARDGCDLAICGRRPAQDVADTIRELESLGADVLYCAADISDADARTRLLRQVREHYGHVNALVNNAGVAPETRADILQASEESFERLMRINVQGPYFLTQAVANWMIEQKRADRAGCCIVNITSTSATVASTNRGDYCMTKAALSMATTLWATRLAEYGIPVYEIRPGIIDTDMTSVVKERYDRLIAEGLLLQARWGRPEDVGRAAAALIRGDLAYSTGAVITVDGGMTVPRL